MCKILSIRIQEGEERKYGEEEILEKLIADKFLNTKPQIQKTKRSYQTNIYSSQNANLEIL